MPKHQSPKPMFSLSPVVFHDSLIAGRGVFARKRFAPGQVIVPYAPKQRRVDRRSPEAAAAAETKLTLLSGNEVIIPDTTVPGGWLCNHSCDPNATLYASGQGRIECRRAIAPGEEITIFYGWVSQNDRERDPCRCGAPNCRRTINFDVSDEDLLHVDITPDNHVVLDDVLRARLADYVRFLESIGQEQVQETIATTIVRMKRRQRA
jgi:SET domain-containing protein